MLRFLRFVVCSAVVFPFSIVVGAVGQDKPPAVTTDGPAPIVHPHKIFVDTANNKLFWPMDKPFWVRLATSPDSDAPSYLLQRVAPDSDITTEKYNKEGIGLEIQGKQFIRWFNYVTKQTVNLQFFTDGDPPVTKATCVGAPMSAQPQMTFYGVGLSCSLASVDDLSGVDTTYLSVNNAPYAPYTQGITLNKEGEFAIRYYAIDRVGYAEKPSLLRFTVDLTPPVTIHAIVGNAIGDVLSTQAKFRITSTDSLSGVAAVQARFDQEDFKPVSTGEVSVENLPDGQHTLSYYATDKVNNRETAHVVPFYLDRTPPTTEAKVIGDQYMAPNGTRYVSGRSKVQLSAEDNKIGVDKIVYSFDAADFQQYSQPFDMPLRAGAAKLSYRAADRLGNTSAVVTLPYIMDLAPPQSTYRITGPMYQDRSDIYITRDSRVELSAVDDASGLLQIQYQAEGAPQPQTYTQPLEFADENRRLVRYWATDRVNNRELERAIVLITDNTPPEIFANFSLTPTSTSGGLPVYRRGTSVFLGATDNSVGVHKIYYRFNGGAESEYAKPLVLDHEGTFDLLIRADDNLGNKTAKHVRFIIRG